MRGGRNQLDAIRAIKPGVLKFFEKRGGWARLSGFTPARVRTMQMSRYSDAWEAAQELVAEGKLEKRRLGRKPGSAVEYRCREEVGLGGSE